MDKEWTWTIEDPKRSDREAGIQSTHAAATMAVDAPATFRPEDTGNWLYFDSVEDLITFVNQSLIDAGQEDIAAL